MSLATLKALSVFTIGIVLGGALRLAISQAPPDPSPLEMIGTQLGVAVPLADVTFHRTDLRVTGPLGSGGYRLVGAELSRPAFSEWWQECQLVTSRRLHGPTTKVKAERYGNLAMSTNVIPDVVLTDERAAYFYLAVATASDCEIGIVLPEKCQVWIFVEL